MSEYLRSYALEDISIRSGPGNNDGRTVEAYASVFDVPTRISDQDGQYEEVISRNAFSDAINKARPEGGREAWGCGVFYNHGKNLYGGASERYSMPIGVCIDMRADSRGLLTVTRYHKSAEDILEAIQEGSIRAYSFSGAFLSSTPSIRSAGGRYKADRNGRLPTVKRTQSTLREYGPTPFPAYAAAEIVGVRASGLDSKAARRKELQRELSVLQAKLIIAEGPARERQRSKLRALEIIARGDSIERRVAALRSAGIEDRRSRWSR